MPAVALGILIFLCYDEFKMIFVNFKTYKQGTGEAAVKLAKICQEVEKETSVKTIPVVQAVDIFRISCLGIEAWAQYLDDIEYGANTGQILPEAVIEAGAKGTILNHSENKLPVEVIESIISKLSNFQIANFGVLVCCESLEEGKEIAKFKPDLIAYEPPELIGGDISVSLAKSEIIGDFVREISEIPILVGAGIHNQKDVKKAIELGAVGVLVSSAVVEAKDPKLVLLDLAGGFK